MFPMWPAAVLAPLLGHVRASLTLPKAEAPDNFECHLCSKGGSRDEIQPRPTRTLIQVQRQQGFHDEKIEETQAGHEDEHNVAGPHLQTNHSQATVQHLPRASVELRTHSRSTGLNITPTSHQQHGPTAQAGIGAVQRLQMLYVKSRRKIEAMVNTSGDGMQDFTSMLKYLFGFSLLVCLLLMFLAAYRRVSTDTYRFWPHHSGWQGPSTQLGSFSRADNHRYLGTPGKECATPFSGCHVPSNSRPQQQHKQQHTYLPILPLQSRGQSRQHTASLPASPAEDASQAPCICPELLVPPGTECRLLLPRVITKDIHPPGCFTILSPDGAAVFSLTAGSSRGATSHGKRLLTLHSAVTEGMIFASCDAVVLDQGEPEKLAINDKAGEHFADVQWCGADRSATLAPQSGPSATIRFDDQQAGMLLIVNSNGKLLAIAEMIDDSVQALRIGAKVDVGLMTILMLSFNLLETEHKIDSRG